jgi:hypothetical protein
VALFQLKLALPGGMMGAYITPPPGMSLCRAAKFMKMADVLARAYRSPGKHLFCIVRYVIYYFCSVILGWSAEEYVRSMPARPTGLNADVENTLSSMFPPLHAAPYPMVDEPICIADRNGVIVYWYLPQCLTRDRQVIPALSPV